MTREEIIAYGKDYYRDLITACCEIDEKHKEFVRMSLEALEQEPFGPCDLCRFNPPSSADGKPCTICPAEKGGE